MPRRAWALRPHRAEPARRVPGVAASAFEEAIQTCEGRERVNELAWTVVSRRAGWVPEGPVHESANPEAFLQVSGAPGMQRLCKRQGDLTQGSW